VKYHQVVLILGCEKNKNNLDFGGIEISDSEGSNKSRWGNKMSSEGQEGNKTGHPPPTPLETHQWQ